MPAVRYNSPTWGGFRFETSWGKKDLTGPSGGLQSGLPTPEANFWDIAVFYTADWNSIKLSAAAAYTWQESAALYWYSRAGLLQTSLAVSASTTRTRSRGQPVPDRRQHPAQAVRPWYLRHVPD